MNKLEKVAIRYARKNGRPLVLAFNSMSYLRVRAVHLATPADGQISICSQIRPRAMVCYINSKLVQRLGQKV